MFMKLLGVATVLLATIVRAEVPLTEDGRAVAVIVIGDRAGEVEQHSAKLLIDELQRMSGARLNVVRTGSLGAITVKEQSLHAAAAPAGIRSFVILNDRELAEKLGVNDEGLKPGGIRVVAAGNTVTLLGGQPQIEGEVGSDPWGPRHAVIDLLERLGCRQLWPGEVGRVRPSQSSVRVAPLDYRYNPQIRARGIRMNNGGETRYLDGLKQLKATRDSLAETRKARGVNPQLPEAEGAAWAQWMRLGGSMPGFGHAGGGLRQGYDVLAETHPEWFAMQQDGTRTQRGDRWVICVSNQELIEHIANDIIANVKPGQAALVSLDFNDGSGDQGFCLCPNCEALDPPDAQKVETIVFGAINPSHGRRERSTIMHASLSDRHVHYWNQIAQRVTAVHPQVLLGVSAYALWTLPPVREKLHPKLVVRYVPSEADLLPGWRAAGASRVFWRPNNLIAGRRDGKLRVIVRSLADSMREFAQAGIVQTDMDSIIHNWSVHGLSYYAAARLAWDPTLQAEAIVRDYTEHGFGAGAAYIQQYMQLAEQAKGSYSPELIGQLRDLLKSAEAADRDPDITHRIEFLRVGLNYTDIAERLNDLVKRNEAGESIDREQVKRLGDLHAMALHDIAINYPMALNVPYLTLMSGGFNPWIKIGASGALPSDPALLQRLQSSEFGMTGCEQSIDELFAVYGLK